ncbi:hypothetical protein [Sphingomonas bacterium]|uniref:hypothetical protein n=1 Tax=Sphingomonas bacterium TaxID=1895847 RepID=UPI001576739F|nr:hypothetical protein [Sphingomonas bacterium]
MADANDAARAIARLDYEALTAEAAQFQQRQLALVDRALQSLMLINGGALVALFTLIGSKASLHVHTQTLWDSFVLFAAGMCCTLLANFAAFFAQGLYYQSSQFQAWNAQQRAHDVPETHDFKSPHRAGDRSEIIGIFAAFAALAAFITGCAFAFAGVVPA